MSFISSLAKSRVDIDSLRLREMTSIAVAKNSLDAQRIEGEALIALIEESVPTSTHHNASGPDGHLGHYLDIKA